MNNPVRTFVQTRTPVSGVRLSVEQVANGYIVRDGSAHIDAGVKTPEYVAEDKDKLRALLIERCEEAVEAILEGAG